MAEEEQTSQPIAMEENRERFRERAIAENFRAAAPVVTDLAAAGFAVESVADLYNLRLNYKGAIPILLRWLPRVENLAVKEAIVRALSVKWAKPWAARPLIEEFHTVQDPSDTGIKWAIGNALEVVADDSVFDELVQIARDRQHGRARQMVVLALGEMRDPRTVDVLIELLEDDQVAAYALAALGKLKAVKARPYAERLLSHPSELVRKEAQRLIEKIDKMSNKN